MPRLSIVPSSCVLSNNHNYNYNHKNTSIQMVHYQSIPAATDHVNAEQDDTAKILHKSIMVRRISGAMLILFVGLGVVATHIFSSGRIINANTPVSATPAAAALLRSTTTAVAGGGDHCCAPATGTWVGLSSSTDDDSNGAYETCYSNCDTDDTQYSNDWDPGSGCLCWSKSYYDGDNWENCTPEGGSWTEYGSVEMQSIGADQETFCGTPCQDFDKSVKTC